MEKSDADSSTNYNHSVMQPKKNWIKTTENDMKMAENDMKMAEKSMKTAENDMKTAENSMKTENCLLFGSRIDIDNKDSLQARMEKKMNEIVLLNNDIKELKDNANLKEEKLKLLTLELQNENTEIERLNMKIVELMIEKDKKARPSVVDASTMVTFKSNSDKIDKQNLLLIQKNEEITQENRDLKQDSLNINRRLKELEFENAKLISNTDSQVDSF